MMPDLKVYGNGWDVDGVNFMGPITPSQVLDEFAKAKTCFYVPHTPGFQTGKPYVAASCNCIPCISVEEVLLALDYRNDVLSLLKKSYVPDFSKLQQVLFEGVYGGGYEPGDN
jgi:hypothetical protein